MTLTGALYARTPTFPVGDVQIIYNRPSWPAESGTSWPADMAELTWCPDHVNVLLDIVVVNGITVGRCPVNNTLYGYEIKGGYAPV